MRKIEEVLRLHFAHERAIQSGDRRGGQYRSRHGL